MMLAALLSFFVLPFAEASEMAPPALATAVQQLRQAAGRWNVTTTRYAENGAVAARCVRHLALRLGRAGPRARGPLRHSRLEPGGGHALLRERAPFTLEMAPVGADGQLWVMSGPAGAETRTTLTRACRRAPMLQRHTRSASAPTASSRGWSELRRRQRAGSRATTSCSGVRAPARTRTQGPDAAPDAAAALRTAHVACRHRRA